MERLVDWSANIALPVDEVVLILPTDHHGVGQQHLIDLRQGAS